MEMKKLLFATTLALAVTSATAWGPREQGALAGLVIGSTLLNGNYSYNRGYYNAAPVYVQPQQQFYVQPQIVYPRQQQMCGYNVYCGPTSCYTQAMTDQYGNVISYQTNCR